MTEKGSILFQLINSMPFDNVEFLRVLEKCTPEDVNSEEQVNLRSLLFFAAQKNLSDAIKALIDKGAKLNEEDVLGFKPIDIALHYQNKEAIIILAKKGERANSMMLHKVSDNIKGIYNSAVQGR